VHAPGGADDRIDRAGRYAERAPDAERFVDDGDAQWHFRTIGRIQGLRRAPQQLRKGVDAGVSTRRALVDVGTLRGNRLGIGSTAFVTAFRALGLRQQGIDLIGEGGR
jgi:hypothetical protein